MKHIIILLFGLLFGCDSEEPTLNRSLDPNLFLESYFSMADKLRQIHADEDFIYELEYMPIEAMMAKDLVKAKKNDSKVKNRYEGFTYLNLKIKPKRGELTQTMIDDYGFTDKEELMTHLNFKMNDRFHVNFGNNKKEVAYYHFENNAIELMGLNFSIVFKNDENILNAYLENDLSFVFKGGSDRVPINMSISKKYINKVPNLTI